MKTIEIALLPPASIDAAEVFFRKHLNKVTAHFEQSQGDLVLIFPHAETDHDDWRRAAARDLARKFAPQRVNIISGGEESDQSEALVYLRDAPGITGQYLPLA
ncbi:MAG: Rossmann fold domain-containing protein [Erythrobacter sp.]